MEFVVIKSKSTPKSQISSLACEKSMQVTHYKLWSARWGGRLLSLLPAPQQDSLRVVHVRISLADAVCFFPGYQSCIRKKEFLSVNIILFCYFSWRLQGIFYYLFLVRMDLSSMR